MPTNVRIDSAFENSIDVLRAQRIKTFNELTNTIRSNDPEPGWPQDKSDKELLGEERVSRFG